MILKTYYHRMLVYPFEMIIEEMVPRYDATAPILGSINKRFELVIIINAYRRGFG